VKIVKDINLLMEEIKMKRQAIIITLNTLKQLKKEIDKEIKELNKIVEIKDKMNIGILIPIINYPTESNGKKLYCSDTWQFEMDLKNDYTRNNKL